MYYIFFFFLKGVLENFKGKDGGFLNLYNQLNEEIETILNLFRASLIGFHGEEVMEETKLFSITYLKQVLPKIDSSNLSREVPNAYAMIICISKYVSCFSLTMLDYFL